MLLEATVNLKIRFLKERVLQAVPNLESSLRHTAVLILGSKQVHTANYPTKHLFAFYATQTLNSPGFTP